MGISNFKKVMLTDAWLLWMFACVSIAVATVCPPGEQYWNPEQETCVNCTRCDTKGHVVLRPCEVHRDTLCGPLSELEIDWSWLAGRKQHRRHNRKHHHHNYGEHRSWDSVTETATLHGASELYQEVTSTEAPFASTEALVWDWQAIALTLAVFACLLFFLVAGLYSIHQARQWKRLKDNFEADVEELSARLNLMVTSGEFGDNLEPNTGTINDGNYLSNHCVYLEQLLVRKDSKIGPGNVYIEESNTNTSSKS